MLVVEYAARVISHFIAHTSPGRRKKKIIIGIFTKAQTGGKLKIEQLLRNKFLISGYLKLGAGNRCYSLVETKKSGCQVFLYTEECILREIRIYA